MVLTTAGAVIAAEAVAGRIDVRAGVAAHAVVLAALLAGAVFAPSGYSGRPVRAYLLGLSLVPLSRVIVYALPFTDVALTTRAATTGVLFLVAVLLCVPALALGYDDLGLRRAAAGPQLLVVGGCLALAPLFGAVLHPGELAFRSPQADVPAAVVALAGLAAVEELAVRGLLLGAAADLAGKVAQPAVAAVWATLFLGERSLMAPVLALAAGLALGWSRLRTGSVWGAIAGHAVISLVSYLLWPHVAHLR